MRNVEKEINGLEDMLIKIIRNKYLKNKNKNKKLKAQ